MKLYGYLQTIPMAFFSKDLYRQVAQQWRGRSFVYLLVLLSICWALIGLTAASRLSHYMNKALVEVSAQMPTLYFHAGKMTTKKAGPFFIRLQGKSGYKQVVAVIDTSEKYKNFEKSEALILVTSQQVTVKKSLNTVNQYQFPEKFEGQFGPKEFERLIGKAKKILFPLAFVSVWIAGLIICYMCYLLLSLLIAALGLIFAGKLKRQLDYAALMSLSLVVFTPVIIVSTLMMLFKWHFPKIIFSPAIQFSSGYVLYALLIVLYLYFAITASSEVE